ncbi:MAG: hypothetical protein LBL65_05670 [Campylobacteraceae bacterium]|jgi:hypothetical protein|nr:hypothetical protein [Campylobacteraceae bacterium]
MRWTAKQKKRAYGILFLYANIQENMEYIEGLKKVYYLENGCAAYDGTKYNYFYNVIDDTTTVYIRNSEDSVSRICEIKRGVV